MKNVFDKLSVIWNKGSNHSLLSYLILLLIIGFAVVGAATNPNQTKHGALRGVDWSLNNIPGTTLTANSAGTSVDIGGLPNLCYYVSISSAATITPQVMPIGGSTWLDLNPITSTGVYTDNGLYGAAKWRAKWSGNTGTIWMYVGGIPITGKPGAGQN